jgi:hypothetical protein
MYGMAAVESRLCSQIVAPGIVSAPRTRRFAARMGLARDPGGRARATGRHAQARRGTFRQEVRRVRRRRGVLGR